MKKKENKSAGSHGIGNRTVIGIICIVAALLLRSSTAFRTARWQSCVWYGRSKPAL